MAFRGRPRSVAMSTLRGHVHRARRSTLRLSSTKCPPQSPSEHAPCRAHACRCVGLTVLESLVAAASAADKPAPKAADKAAADKGGRGVDEGGPDVSWAGRWRPCVAGAHGALSGANVLVDASGSWWLGRSPAASEDSAPVDLFDDAASLAASALLEVYGGTQFRNVDLNALAPRLSSSHHLPPALSPLSLCSSAFSRPASPLHPSLPYLLLFLSSRLGLR